MSKVGALIGLLRIYQVFTYTKTGKALFYSVPKDRQDSVYCEFLLEDHMDAIAKHKDETLSITKQINGVHELMAIEFSLDINARSKNLHNIREYHRECQSFHTNKVLILTDDVILKREALT